WIASRRTWVNGDGIEPETRAMWFRRLESIQRTGRRFVVALDCSDAEVEQSLRAWAEMAYSRLEPGHVPEQLARALLLMKSQTVAGWRALLGIEDAFLAIANPPEFGTPNWFWQPLLN